MISPLPTDAFQALLSWGVLSVKTSPGNGLAGAKHSFFFRNKEVAAVYVPSYFPHPCQH